MEQFDHESSAATSLALSAESIEYLSVAALWARFLAILGFVISGLMVVAAVTALVIIRQSSPDLAAGDAGAVYDDPRERLGIFTSVMPFFYLISGAVYFLICTKLYRFAIYTRRAIRSAEHEEMHAAVRNLASFFKSFGILSILGLVIYVLLMISVILAFLRM